MKLKNAVLVAGIALITLVSLRGVGGDAAIIQSMIAQVGKGVVVLDPRPYILDSTVSIPSSITLRGQGPATHIKVLGNIYGLDIAGSHVTIEDMAISAVEQQTSGGGITFSSAEFNDTIQNIVFEHNLSTSIDVATANDNRGIYHLRNLRWNGVDRSRTAIRIGDGIHHVTDVTVTDMSGTASTPADMNTWVKVMGNTDTIFFDKVTLIKGGAGFVVGANASGPAAVTGFGLQHGTAIESMTGYGVLINSANNVRLHDLSVAQNQGGVGFASGVRGANLSGSVIHSNLNDGVTIWPGADGVKVVDNIIADNNISGSQWGFGVSVGAGVSNFSININNIGNGLVWGNGKQRYCVFVAPGSSFKYSITGNACSGHTVTNTVYDGGTGGSKVVKDNY
jgi:hypothetical protein